MSPLNTTGKLIFGFQTAEDWLAKVKRERQRYIEEKDPVRRADHAVNFSFSIASLQEWIFVLHVKDNLTEWPSHRNLGAFSAWANSQCLVLPILADLGNAAKHRSLDRRRSDLQSAGLGPVSYQIDAEHWEQFRERIGPASEILAIRTIIDDDMIVAFEVRTETFKLTAPGGFHLFISVCDTAIAFWEKFLTDRQLI